MGQYFHAILRDKGRFRKFTSIYFPCGGYGMKIHEHAYMDNLFVLAVANELYRKPHRLAWVGDEAPLSDYLNNGMPEAAAKVLHSSLNLDHEDLTLCKFTFANKVVINHSKRLFLDMGKFIREYEPTSKNLLCPLPYLTAIGNGYREGGVGSWAWDVISIDDKPPIIGYDEYFVPFMRE